MSLDVARKVKLIELAQRALETQRDTIVGRLRKATAAEREVLGKTVDPVSQEERFAWIDHAAAHDLLEDLKRSL